MDERDDPVASPGASGPDEVPPEPPKARSVLSDILSRTALEVEAENRRLQEEIQRRMEEERLEQERKEQEARAAAQAAIEAARQERLRQIEEYERRKREEEEARKAKENPAAVVVQAPAPARRSRAPIFIAVGVVLVAAIGGGIYATLPKGEPVVFALEKTPVTAQPGTMQTAPVPFGPATVEADMREVPPERVVAFTSPGKYQAPPPQPKVARAPVRKAPEPTGPKIKIGPSIFGTKGKVVK